MNTSLEDRADIESALADAHRARGLAALHGKTDVKSEATIEELERKLETLADAAAVRLNIEREEGDAAHADKITRLRTERADADAARLKARKEAEIALRQYVKASQAELTHEKTIRETTAAINRATNTKESIINVMQTEKEMSMRAMSLLRTVTGHRSVFGYFQFPSTLPKPESSWT